jgi:predicted membrane-bound spermidine synthase
VKSLVMRLRPLLILFLFFISGACGLVYEVVWIRLLSLTLSVTVYALTTVLCAFMAGLGLGALLAALVADRVRRPLLAFALIELGIGVCGIAVPRVLFELDPAYVWLRHAFEDVPALFVSGRFLLAFVVLVVPATLMGATLPLLSRAIVADLGTVAAPAGALYGVNTLGAVAGCVIAGFWLVPKLGLRNASALAASFNLVVALCALALARRGLPAPPAPATNPPGPARSARMAWLASAAFAVSGFTAMGYEILWTRALEPFAHNSTYAYTAMLAMFLAGIGAGSLAAARIADRVRRPLVAIGLLQFGIAATVLGALFVYSGFEHWIPELVDRLGGIPSWPRAVVLLFAEASLTMLATTVLFGAIFPLVVRAVVQSLGHVGRRIGAAYAANTVGSILGTLSMGFVLLPTLGVRDAFLALMLCNAAVGGLLLGSELRGLRRALVFAGTVATLATFPLVVPPDFFRRGFENRYGELLFYREEVTDTIMVTGQGPGGRWLRFADGRGTAGTGSYFEDRMYGHIPLLLHPDPRQVLQITFGVGNSLAAVATHPVENIVCVELSPGVIDAAPYFESTNRGVLRDPRIDLRIEDGRNFLLASPSRYDVIRLDPPELHTRGVVNLYTSDFYELAREHLAPGGIFSIWVNAVMTPVEDLRLLVRTVAAVFPHVSIWRGPAFYSWVINGSLEPRPPDLDRLEQAFADERIRSDLASIGIASPYHFLRHFVMAGREILSFAGDGPVVTDDLTVLDFSVPRSRDAAYGIGNINTNNWLVAQIHPDGERDVIVVQFFEKLQVLSRFHRPVTPHVSGLDAAGIGREELSRRVDAAKVTLP